MPPTVITCIRESVDLRKGFNSLCGVVQSVMQRALTSGDAFTLINSNHATIKFLHWECGELVIYHTLLPHNWKR